MRFLKVVGLWLLLFSISFPRYSFGESSTPSDAADSAARLPVTRVILYKNGVGYFDSC